MFLTQRKQILGEERILLILKCHILLHNAITRILENDVKIIFDRPALTFPPGHDTMAENSPEGR